MLPKQLAIFILLIAVELAQSRAPIKCSCICPEIADLFTYEDIIVLFDETGTRQLLDDTVPVNNQTGEIIGDRTSKHYFISRNVTREQECVCKRQILPYLPKRWTKSVDYCSMCMCNYDKKLKELNIKPNSFHDKERRNRRAATARPERLWEHGVIPYEIESNFSGTHRALFKQAMRHWELHTCIKFVERTPEHPNYIVFTERPCGCCSFVGKRGNGPQAISIGKNCDKLGIVIHELGHVVGFWHEHTRPDRDTNVQIITKNIMTGQEYNFNKLSEEEISSLGLPYDFDSIMHYAKNTFSKSTFLDTILPIENPLLKVRPEIGQRIRLSKGDILQTNLLYRCPKCGQTLQEPAGQILSPEKASNSSESGALNCEWRITATQGERIQLKISEFELHEESNCENNYLEIRDGYSIKEKLIGRYCAKDIVPESLMSSGYRLLLTYRTSSDYEHKGFKLHYEFICGGELSVDDISLLQSPGYPDDYTPNKECAWVIKTKPNYQIALKFLSFELENHESCVYDYVEVRDGNSESANFLGKFCGLKTPAELHSSGNELFVKFVSDSTVQKGGFASTFNQEYDECAEGSHGCAHACVNTLGGYRCECKIGFELHSDGKNCEAACGGVIDSENGTLLSPSFPDPYPPNKACIWEIVAPMLYRITLNFTRFDLEGNNLDCGYDSVEVKSKLSANEFRHHGTFCGSRLPQPITSFRNQMRIEFTTDNSVQKTGFSANFFTDLDECSTNNGGCQHICKNTIGSYKCYCQNGFVLHTDRHSCKEGTCMFNLESHSGELSSPNYPGLYESRKTCVWVITTTPGHRVKISFHHFELEIHPQCFYDHLSVYDGDSVSASLVGRFCGNKISNPMIASSNSMYLVFKSDATVQRKGFHGVYSTVCGGKLKASNQVEHLYSHAKYGDADYEKLEDCDWFIEVPANKRIRLKFLTFELEYEQNCSYDYVQVFDGSYDDLVLLLGKYCGNQLPKEMVSTGTSMLIRFHSDDSINSKGFSISYVTLDSNDINSD